MAHGRLVLLPPCPRKARRAVEKAIAELFSSTTAAAYKLCGACIEGRPEDCSGWCRNYHTGVTS